MKTDGLIRDLGAEFENLPDDIQSLIETYGHGDCHHLTNFLIEWYNFPVVAVMAENSGMPVHSAARLEGNRTFDAYGINTLDRTCDRYREGCKDYLGSDAYIQEVDEEFIAMHAGCQLDDDFETVREDLKTLVDFLGIDLNALSEASRAEKVTDYIQS